MIECIQKKAIGKLNLASGKVVSFYNIAKEIKKITGSKIKIKFTKRSGPMPHNGYRPFDISLIKNKFKKLMIHDFKIGINKYNKI